MTKFYSAIEKDINLRMKSIPNLFTLLNLFFGCIAVILILQNGITVLAGPGGAQYISMPEKIGVSRRRAG